MTSPATAHRGEWVQIHDIVLRPQERTGHIPADTQQVPFESWVKGILEVDEASIGDRVSVRTVCGRTVEGELIAINPGFTYGFGDSYVPELLHIGGQVRDLVKGAQR